MGKELQLRGSKKRSSTRCEATLELEDVFCVYLCMYGGVAGSHDVQSRGVQTRATQCEEMGVSRSPLFVWRGAQGAAGDSRAAAARRDVPSLSSRDLSAGICSAALTKSL